MDETKKTERPEENSAEPEMKKSIWNDNLWWRKNRKKLATTMIEPSPQTVSEGVAAQMIAKIESGNPPSPERMEQILDNLMDF
jgi:hypothetical protein